MSDPPPKNRVLLKTETLTTTFGARCRIAAHVSRSRYALPMTPFLESMCSQCSPLIGEYVFDFAVVLFGVGLLLPHGFHAQAKINLFGPFSDPAPSSGAVRRDTASTHAHTHYAVAISLSYCVMCVARILGSHSS